MRRPNAIDEDAVAVDERIKVMPDGIAGTTDTDGLHHTRVSQLLAAQLSVKHLGKRENKTYCSGYWHTITANHLVRWA